MKRQHIFFSLLVFALVLFLLPIFAVAKPPDEAVKFVILKIKPKDQPVGAPVTVTVEAQKKNNKADESYQDDVTLVASGSATGEGLVDIVNGVGSLQINDLVAETVALSLSDTQSTGLDASSTEEINFVAGVPIPTPEGAVKRQMVIVFSGQAYPASKAEVMFKSSIDALYQEVPEAEYTISNYGAFRVVYIGLVDIAPLGGNYFFGLRAEDKDNRKTGIKSFNIGTLSNQLVFENIWMPPTIGFLRGAIRKGDFLTVTGYAEPSSIIEIEVDDKTLGKEAEAIEDGFYKALIDTSELSFGEHVIRTRQKRTSDKTSDFSLKKTFVVSKLFFPEVDFNNDDKVDISDLSIFLPLWKSENKEEKMRLDFNGDGKVDISDFSVFLRTIKK